MANKADRGFIKNTFEDAKEIWKGLSFPVKALTVSVIGISLILGLWFGGKSAYYGFQRWRIERGIKSDRDKIAGENANLSNLSAQEGEIRANINAREGQANASQNVADRKADEANKAQKNAEEIRRKKYKGTTAEDLKRQGEENYP